VRVLNCAAARRRLQAYHDGELPIGEQIDVSAHLEWCDDCVEMLTDMQLLRATLRTAAVASIALTGEEDANLHASVVSRVRAEDNMSFSTHVRALFDDMHFVYAGLGAGAATVACVMIMLSMMRFATSERSPGSNQNPVVVDARMLMPRALDQVLMTAASKDGDEAVFTLSAVVTREGRIVNLELHQEDGQTPEAGSSDAQAVQNLLGAVSRARFEPAKVAGLPVAVNMVWMVAHTTVRAKGPFDFSTPPSTKKRQVNLITAHPARRTSIA